MCPEPPAGTLAAMKLRVLAVTAGLMLLTAACGSSPSSNSGPSSTGTGSGGAPSAYVTRVLAFARCMRAHGVSNFPDPNGNGIQITQAIAQSPAFKTAQTACKQYLPNGGVPPTTAPGERAAALAFAKCMRTHGVPDFPDPLTSVPSSPLPGAVAIIDLRGMAFELGPGLDPRSPAFQQAASACGLTLPKGFKTPVPAP